MLHQPAAFTLGGDDFAFCQKVQEFGAQEVIGNGDGGYVVHIAAVAEQGFCSTLGFLGFFFTVDQFGHFVGQDHFGFVNGGAFQVAQAAYFVHGQEGKQAQALLYIGVVDVSPVLVEIVGGEFLRIQPYGAAYGLTHFLALAVGQQGVGHAVGRLTVLPADQFHAGNHVGPLVVAAQFHDTVIFLVQGIEVIGLHNHVVHFKEGQSGVAGQSVLVAVSCQHTVYGEMDAHGTQHIHVV